MTSEGKDYREGSRRQWAQWLPGYSVQHERDLIWELNHIMLIVGSDLICLPTYRVPVFAGLMICIQTLLSHRPSAKGIADRHTQGLHHMSARHLT